MFTRPFAPMVPMPTLDTSACFMASPVHFATLACGSCPAHSSPQVLVLLVQFVQPFCLLCSYQVWFCFFCQGHEVPGVRPLQCLCLLVTLLKFHTGVFVYRFQHHEARLSI